jgi:diguanylate cyclase (GGDEF)-like protein
MAMRTIRAFLRAFGDRHTFDPRSNVHLWFGLLWGIPIPLYLLALTEWPHDSGLSEFIHSTGMKAFFLVHPLLFALVFGALGSMRRRLEQENARLIQELRGQAWVDPLTGLYNRRYVMEEFRNILKRAARSGEPIRAVMLDLDGFKAVNDRQGHLAGDVILQKAAAALKGSIRQGDLLGRFGGDEFLLVAMGDASAVKDIVTRCQQAVLAASGLSISAGVTGAATPGEEPETLIRQADVDLAATKQVAYETKGIKRR